MRFLLQWLGQFEFGFTTVDCINLRYAVLLPCVLVVWLNNALRVQAALMLTGQQYRSERTDSEPRDVNLTHSHGHCKK